MFRSTNYKFDSFNYILAYFGLKILTMTAKGQLLKTLNKAQTHTEKKTTKLFDVQLQQNVSS